MENNDFFRQYKDILVDGIDKVRKSGFKRLPLFREMIDTLEGTSARYRSLRQQGDLRTDRSGQLRAAVLVDDGQPQHQTRLDGHPNYAETH